MRLKGKFYKNVVRPTIFYGLECWAVYKRIEQSRSVAKIRILRWMRKVTREDRIRNKYVRSSIGITCSRQDERE